MKQQFAWAIVSPLGKLELYSGQCPIYWRRQIAQQECQRLNPQAHVERVTILQVHKPKADR